MRIVLERYYGDNSITRSVMKVFGKGTGSDDSERLLLACESREPRFADYTEAFPGSAKCCLAVGVFPCKVVATDFCPMTLTVIKSPGHRCCRIGWDDVAQVRTNMVLVGESDGSELPEWRELVNQRETFEKLTALVYRAYGTGEEIFIEIDNERISLAD